jgi:hypothetical protein
MKTYKQPEKIEMGKCFLCGQPCDRYVHFQCALSFYEEKERMIKESRLNLKG